MLVRYVVSAMAPFLFLVTAGDEAAAQTNTGSRVTAEEAKELVAMHNQARRAVGVGPVEWSPQLAAFAQRWADELARTGRFEHRPADGEFAQKYGENLAIGFGGGFGVTAGVRLWLAEKSDYEPGTPIPADFSTFTTGHYTQIVWRPTTHVGAGRAVIATGDRAGWTIIVCNYHPPGNTTGEKPY
jgi:pathogenesis-related protein 1